MEKWIATATLIVVSTGTGFTQDVERGASVFKRCQACHAIGPGAQNKVGPELNGLAGRLVGAVPDYIYSDANKHSGIVWNEANFKEYIKDPMQRSRVQKNCLEVSRTSNRLPTYGCT